MQFQLATRISFLALFGIAFALPSFEPGSPSTALEASKFEKRFWLFCHAGLPSWTCENDYGARCDDSGEFFCSEYPDNGRSCTSRQCWCHE